MSVVINGREFQVFGIRRSGNHAVISWMAHQLDGPVHFLNDSPEFDRPYPPHEMFRNPLYDLPCFVRGDERAFLRERKKYFFHSYEDFDISSLTPERLEANSVAVGRSVDRRRIVVLRDPFNLLASRYELVRLGHKMDLGDVVRLWKVYAREFLGETSHVPGAVFVSFNEWFSDERYRRELSERLGLEFSDAGLKRVPNTSGVGSSFDRTRFDGRAQEMGVLERWRKLAGDGKFRSLLVDGELLEMSRRIFGKVGWR